jgi:hypothetical protein
MCWWGFADNSLLEIFFPDPQELLSAVKAALVLEREQDSGRLTTRGGFGGGLGVGALCHTQACVS